MRFDVLTLFPQWFEPFLSSGINRRAFASGAVDVRLHNPRDWADGAYRRVDDRPFGGGPGMVMMAEPLARCVDHIRNERGADTPVWLFSPTGSVMRQPLVAQWAQGGGAILICGRYEGVDQRFVDAYVTQQISLGDFVLSGGEVPAMALLDAVARLQPGVLGDRQSHEQDSFSPGRDGLLDCPHYTRPESWRGQPVPQVLLSGDHGRIAQWRQGQSMAWTRRLRPDLLRDGADSIREG